MLFVTPEPAAPAPAFERQISVDSTGPQLLVESGLAFLRNRKLVPVEWSRTPSGTSAAATTPARSGYFAMMVLDCAVSQAGLLTNCKVSADPSRLGYENTGAELSTQFEVSDRFMQAHSGQIESIIVQIRLSNSESTDLKGPLATKLHH